ncbi:MAG: FkbM family methyltransferase, partial [Elusimicrobia bacterium]|nr:FkbM family methyltransferase [Elusimicrobiota bacterium]
DLIKIDAEGACAKILKGAGATLAAKPRLVMEVEGGESEVEAVCSLLASHGYRTTRFGFIVYASA